MSNSVWALRDWSHALGIPGRGDSFLYRNKSSKSIELRRADGKIIPAWEEVKYRNDGKHRLGYNPTVETRDISQEDFEAVRARGKGVKEWASGFNSTAKVVIELHYRSCETSGLALTRWARSTERSPSNRSAG